MRETLCRFRVGTNPFTPGEVSPWLKDELKKVASVTLLMSLGLSNDFFSCQTLHLAELSPDDRGLLIARKQVDQMCPHSCIFQKPSRIRG